jgi:hypothetical protein
MRLLTLAAIAQLLLLLSARAELTSEIPFQYQDGLIWLKVHIASKKEPLKFLLDSGASASAIDLRTAQAVRVRLGERQPVEGVTGRAFAYHVNDLQATLMGIALPKSVLAVDLRTVSECCHRHIDGILGVDFFRNRIVRIDFNAGKIYLLKNCEVDTANCDILPIRMSNGALCVPVRIAGNTEQWMRLDTGCDSALECVANGTRKRQIGGPSIAQSGSSFYYVNTSARLGKHCFNNIRAGVHRQQIFPGEDGLLGNALLSKFSVTIDEPGSRVIFEKAR